MTEQELIVGARVRLIRDVCGGGGAGTIIDTIKAGETAEIVAIDLDAAIQTGDAAVVVRFDNHLETLDDWENTLNVGLDRDVMDWDATIDDFEVERGFGQ
jgi:hypothetical protein